MSTTSAVSKLAMSTPQKCIFPECHILCYSSDRKMLQQKTVWVQDVSAQMSIMWVEPQAELHVATCSIEETHTDATPKEGDTTDEVLI